MAIKQRTVSRHPQVHVIPALYVDLSVRRTTQEREQRIFQHDDGTIMAFMNWQSDNTVFPLAGTSSCGPGFWRGTFPGEHSEAVTQWLREHAKSLG